VVKSRSQHCGHIELAGYLANEAGPVPLVLDLCITHDRVGSSTGPTLNGHLCYPNKLDQSLNDAAADKIRKYRADYKNNPPNTVSFIPAIPRTSGRLHIEFVRLLFLQAHRETDRFFAASGVQLAQTDRGLTMPVMYTKPLVLGSQCELMALNIPAKSVSGVEITFPDPSFPLSPPQ
jgi:hypothetical protein